jgi:hypothetical protein
VETPSVQVSSSLVFGARVARGLVTSILCGAALGAAAWLVDRLGFPWTGVIPVNLIGSWLAVAFVLGTTARTPATGALRGLIGLLAAVVAYYILVALFDGGIRAVGASHAAFVWGTVALLAGPCLGLAGGVWRHGAGRPRALAVAVLAAGLIAEALVFGAGRLLNVDVVVDPGALVLGAELVLGLALPVLLLRGGERLTGYVALAVFGALAFVVIEPVTALLRTLADTF